MIIDLADFILRYDKIKNPDTLASGINQTRITCLTKEKQFIVLATEDPKVISSDLTNSHFYSKMHCVHTKVLWYYPLCSVGSDIYQAIRVTCPTIQRFHNKGVKLMHL